MFKKTVTFKDFDDNSQTRDFYFHISKAELLELATSADDMQARIKRIIDAKDGAAILGELRDFIKLSVGVRSDDGQRFIKSAEAQNTLFQSPAYDELLMELATSADACANFVQQLIPEKMQQEMRDQMKKMEQDPKPASISDPFADPEDNRPAWQKEHRLPTEKELREMSREEMAKAMQFRLESNKLAE
jgi:hypothetical protein